MRDIQLNGYIDDELWFGDEITPESLNTVLYEQGYDKNEELNIKLNSYGGSCNAAVRMFDILNDYPGKVNITISGTAASAATVLAQAADTLMMTPGSLFMIHDPSTEAWGNEYDLMQAINLLRTTKESIINIYKKRCHNEHDAIAELMRATTWMDANQALAEGFIDSITDFNSKENGGNFGGITTDRVMNRAEAEKLVNAWEERHRCKRENAKHDAKSPTDSIREVKQDESVVDVSHETSRLADEPQNTVMDEQPTIVPVKDEVEPEEKGTNAEYLMNRLNLLKLMI